MKFAPAVLGLLTVALATACGDSGDSSSTSTPTGGSAGASATGGSPGGGTGGVGGPATAGAGGGTTGGAAGANTGGTTTAGSPGTGGTATAGSPGIGGTSTAGSPGTGGTAQLVDIYYEGIHYPATSGGETELLRFASHLYDAQEWVDGFNPQRARTTAGGSIIFETTSPTVRVSFRYDADDEHRWGAFGVSQNGGAIQGTNAPPTDLTTTLTISSESPGSLVRYRVILPPWSNPILTGIELDAGHELSRFAEPIRPVYVALGDSITHGTGQNASYLGYAWQTAEDLGMELFNLAVGGSKIAVPIADTVSDWPRIDLVTVMVGYNDWMNEGKTTQDYHDAYDLLIGTVRTHHPNVPIFCLNLLDSDQTTSSQTGIDISEFRGAIAQIVTDRQNAGDANLYLAPSDAWVGVSDLSDGIHLSPDGAATFSDALTGHLQTTLGW